MSLFQLTLTNFSNFHKKKLNKLKLNKKLTFHWIILCSINIFFYFKERNLSDVIVVETQYASKVDIEELHAIINQNHYETMQSIAKIQVTLDAIISKITESSDGVESNSSRNNIENNNELEDFPLETKDSLDNFESSLRNKPPFRIALVINK